MKKSIIEAVTDLVLPYLQEQQIELVDMEYVKEGSNYFLRVFVDCEGGIDVDRCGDVSHYLSAKLDESDPIEGAYFLEVSSPGAERPLKKPEDFLAALQKHVLITTYQPIDGLKEFEGTLVEYGSEELAVQVGKKVYRLPLNMVAGARFAIVF